MINKYWSKNHQGEWIDQTPDIPAKINFNGKFAVSTRRYGAEADLGRSLYETTRRESGVVGVLKAAKDFHPEFLAENFLPLADKIEFGRVRILPKDQKFDDDVFFEYSVERGGSQIYVCRVVAGKKTKNKNLLKTLAEIDRRRN
ncbi:hypothetical protein J4449_03100 [Candidatus Woesearchaeota archaeon]|nr:hypothetical protein [Candidatus Woesearchaeota archaeon]